MFVVFCSVAATLQNTMNLFPLRYNRIKIKLNIKIEFSNEYPAKLVESFLQFYLFYFHPLSDFLRAKQNCLLLFNRLFNSIKQNLRAQLGVKITPGRPEINFVPSQLCAVYSLELDQKPGIKLHLRRHSLCFISFSA